MCGAAAAQNAAMPAAAVVPDSAAIAAATADSTAAAAFMQRFGAANADSLMAILRNDYSVCVGDPARVGREQLFRWKAHIDSTVMRPDFANKFQTYVAVTGVRAHHVRPCEPVVYFERETRRRHTTDSTIAAQRTARERATGDSALVTRELSANRPNPADILNIPAGISRTALQTILDRSNVITRSVQNYIQVDRIKFHDLVVNVAFYFDANGRYNGYELETEALRAEEIDRRVRPWADQLIRLYEEKLGPPNVISRVGFRDIRQGRLSIVANWERGPSRPKVLVGLATHDHLYYAKVMVSY
jgi:hypothetical protein